MAEWWAATGWAWELATLGFMISAQFIVFRINVRGIERTVHEQHTQRVMIIDSLQAIRTLQEAFLATEKRVADLEKHLQDS